MTRVRIRELVVDALGRHVSPFVASALQRMRMVAPCVRYIWHDYRACVWDERGRHRIARLHSWLAKRAMRRCETMPACLDALEDAFQCYAKEVRY